MSAPAHCQLCGSRVLRQCMRCYACHAAAGPLPAVHVVDVLPAQLEAALDELDAQAEREDADEGDDCGLNELLRQEGMR